MSRLSRALKRLKGKPKQTKDESTTSMTLTAKVETSQPLQSDSKPSSGAPKETWLPLSQSQDSQGPNSASTITTSSPQEPAPLSGQMRQNQPPCRPALQSTKAVPSPKKISKPGSAFVEAASQPGPQAALNESRKRAPQFESPRQLSDGEEVKDQYVAPEAPKKVVQQPSPSEKAPVVNAQPQPTPKTTVTAPKAKPQPKPKTTPRAPKALSKPVSIPRPAVQTHAGLYSGFTPSVAAVDQPTPKTLSNAQKAASDVLYMRQDDYNAVRAPLFAPSAASAQPLGKFRTGGPLGGGQYSSTSGAFGGGAVAQTGGRFGEATVSKTGASLGEAFGVQGCESETHFEKELDEEYDKKLKEETRKLLLEYFPKARLDFLSETSKATLYDSGVGGSRIQSGFRYTRY